MANTITNLIPDIIAGVEIVSREIVGMVPRVARSSTAERAAKDTTIRSPVAPQGSSYSITPSMTPLASSDLVYTNRTIALDTLKGYKFHYQGEENRGLALSGAYPTLFAQNIAQGIRTLVNEIENALCALYYNSARAYGTAGTTPFSSDLSDLSAAKQILDKNGAPEGDRHCIVDHDAAFKLRTLTQLTNVNQSGDTNVLRDGNIGRIMGFAVASSEKVNSHTVGTSTGQDVNGGDAIGTTSITYHGGDGGTILVGDTVSIAGDTSGPNGSVSRYVVNTAITAAAGELVINSPGLISAWADTTEIALGTTAYVANLAFSRDAFVLATRPPAKPEGGDAAVEERVITDPVSGLSFLLSRYVGHHMANYEISVLYGVGLGNPEHSAIIMG